MCVVVFVSELFVVNTIKSLTSCTTSVFSASGGAGCTGVIVISPQF